MNTHILNQKIWIQQKIIHPASFSCFIQRLPATPQYVLYGWHLSPATHCANLNGTQTSSSTLNTGDKQSVRQSVRDWLCVGSSSTHQFPTLTVWVQQEHGVWVKALNIDLNDPFEHHNLARNNVLCVKYLQGMYYCFLRPAQKTNGIYIQYIYIFISPTKADYVWVYG